MTATLKIVLAQINFTVGDIQGNLQKHIAAAKTARDELEADLIVFPELSLIGYPCEDLLLRHSFRVESDAARKILIQEIRDIYCVFGHPHLTANGLHNAISVIYNGNVLCLYAKQRLPNYGVFDEDRYFKPGTDACIVNIKSVPTSVIVCEDLWGTAPMDLAISQGARLTIVANASPFEVDKHEKRLAVLKKRIQKHKIPIVYVNHVCGQDELMFDGGSLVMNAEGELCQFAGIYQETLLPVEIKFDDHGASHVTQSNFKIPTREEKIYQTLVYGVREYVNKNNFPGVLIGVSGGIDSALTLAIAVDALGSDRVRGVIMPSRFTADFSVEDAKILCENFHVAYDIISIEPTYQAFLATLKPIFGEKKFDVTEQNLQSRCRGTIIMALSNQSGAMVLGTGNRTELAVGYCTLYGDMVGGFNALKDIPKSLVYVLTRYRNESAELPPIPMRIIERAPSAELALNQKDEDELSEYPTLDIILYSYLNNGMSKAEIIANGFDKDGVNKIVKLIHRSEYKRKQAAPGTRIDHKSFIKDWRYPLTNRYKE